MNKYSEMSDFEIGKLVAESIYGDEFEYERSIDDTVYLLRNGNFSQEYDLFYDCKDTFDLMINNDISLLKLPCYYHAFAYFNGVTKISHFDESPDRAIAICYLMIKDADNA